MILTMSKISCAKFILYKATFGGGFIEKNTIKENNNGSKFLIVEKDINKSDDKHTYYKIKFIESGYEDSVRSDSIQKGLVKDNLSKSCCGVGVVGYINTREHWKEYRIWEDMIYRCYSKKDKSYKFYGEKGVTVCDRWLRFEYFYQDISKIVGYDEQLFLDGKLKLDKDILSKENKIYSPETTMWVSDLINQKVRTIEYNTRNKKYAIFPDGHIEQIFHVTDFCKKHGLHRQNVNLCLAGKQKATKGFQFYKE